ncbi:hypothetical protein VNO77_14271 [Canavalia gladiata]|uniref:Uncharacterized protein n=1 Tax=Canavalia gladiata TaxID=3824 RepID=A0AAN9M1Q4_CANGL
MERDRSSVGETESKEKGAEMKRDSSSVGEPESKEEGAEMERDRSSVGEPESKEEGAEMKRDSSSVGEPESKEEGAEMERDRSWDDLLEDDSFLDDILAFLPELRDELANSRKSLSNEVIFTSDRWDFMEKLENSTLQRTACAERFKEAQKLCARIEKIIHEEPSKHRKKMDACLKALHRITGDGAWKVLNEIDKMQQCNENCNMEGLQSAFEQLLIEQQNLYEKFDRYFKAIQRLRISENIEEQLQFGSPTVIVNLHAGSPLLKDLAEMLKAYKKDQIKSSEQVPGESSSGTR